jgi:hypothetical protein
VAGKCFPEAIEEEEEEEEEVEVEVEVGEEEEEVEVEEEKEEEEEEEVREDNDVKEDVTVEAGEGIFFTGDPEGGAFEVFCATFGMHSISLCSSTKASSIMMRMSFRIVAHSSS